MKHADAVARDVEGQEPRSLSGMVSPLGG